MELQPSSSSHLVINVKTASDQRAGRVGIDRPPMFILSFNDITYKVRQKQDSSFSLLSKNDKGDKVNPDSTTTRLPAVRTLLDSVSGEAREGEIFAILGASGSGKSTLIDALANRITRESLRGSITLNRDTLESRLLKVISSYVMQDDLLYPMLTVKETLMYSAEFRLPRSVSNERKMKRVEELIQQLGLANAANTIIGDEGHRGVSGGERRRVSIGINIVHNPILLFLDEPTSGLDSTGAFMVVDVLKEIALRGSIVMLSIHQPSYRILNLLDRLLFLARGQTVFYGPPNSLASYFAEFGKPIPDNENPTEFALDLIRELQSTPNGAKDLVDFARKWKRRHPNIFPSSHQSNNLPLDQAIASSFASGRLVSGTPENVQASVASIKKFTNPFWIEMGVLTRRAFTNTNRMPELFIIRLGTIIVTGIILATIYWKLDNTPKGIQERLGFFAIAMSTMFYTCADALPVFMQERYIFMRETSYNAYRRSSYVLSNAIVSFPPLILLSFAFALTTFYAVGLDGGLSGFLFYVAIILGCFWAGGGFVTFLSGVVNHVIVGYTVVVSVLAYFLLFSGFFVSRDRIPVYWIWFHYMSLVKYPYQAVMQNEFSDPNKCFVTGTQMFDNTPIGAFPQPTKVLVLASISTTLGLNLNSTSCIMTGPDILERNAVQDLDKWNCLWVTVGWGFFFRFLFYVVILIGSKNKRK